MELKDLQNEISEFKKLFKMRDEDIEGILILALLEEKERQLKIKKQKLRREIYTHCY